MSIATQSVTTKDAYEKYAELAGKQNDIVDEINSELEGLKQDKAEQKVQIQEAVADIVSSLSDEAIIALSDAFEEDGYGFSLLGILSERDESIANFQLELGRFCDAQGTTDGINSQIANLSEEIKNKKSYISTLQTELDTISERLEAVDEFNETHETKMKLETVSFFCEPGRGFSGWKKRNFNSDYKDGLKVLNDYLDTGSNISTDLYDADAKATEITLQSNKLRDLNSQESNLQDSLQYIAKLETKIENTPEVYKGKLVEALVRVVQSDSEFAQVLSEKLKGTDCNAVRLASLKLHNSLKLENSLIGELAEATETLNSLEATTRKLARKQPTSKVNVDLEKVEKSFTAKAAKSKYRVRSAGRTRSFNRGYSTTTHHHHYHDEGLTMTDAFILYMIFSDNDNHDYEPVDAAYVQDTFGISEAAAAEANIEDVSALEPDYAEVVEELGVDDTEELLADIDADVSGLEEDESVFDIADDEIVSDASDDYGFSDAAGQEDYVANDNFEVEDEAPAASSDNSASLEYSS